MATKLPLTPEQAREVARLQPIAVRLAIYFARREPKGLTYDDLFGAAEEAVTRAVLTHADPNIKLHAYVWARVHSTLVTLIQRTAERLGGRPPNETGESRMAAAASGALGEFACTVEDPTNAWQDSPEKQQDHYDELARDGATALDLGAGGSLWHMRGDEGMVLRLEYLRANRALHEEVARLKPNAATIVHLRCFEELPVAEVVERTGVSESKILRVIAKAIPVLRARMEARGFDDLSFFEGR